MLSPYQIYLIFPILGAVIGAMLWLSYFKKIDALESERTINLCIAFIIGYLTPSAALWLYALTDSLGFTFNGNFFNDLLYAIFGIGVIEEFVKLVGVFIVFRILRKAINEPLDYLVFAGIVALGFSIRENFIYYANYGATIITGRTIIACLAHIINTSICVYGIYRFKIFHKGNFFLNSFVGIGIAILSHGLFDFFLTQEFIGIATPFLATIVYLIGINFWIQMFNNLINYSPYFNYKKISMTAGLYKTVLFWYACLLVLEFIFGFYYKGFGFAIKDVLMNIVNEGILVMIVAARISRLKISKRKYFVIKPQLPIYYTKNDDEDFRFFGLPLKIRGENEDEFRFLEYMGAEIMVCPVSKNNHVVTKCYDARLLKKYFLKNDVVIYLIEIEIKKDRYVFLLKPKTRSITMIDQKYPIGKLMHYPDPIKFQKSHESLPYKALQGLEYVYIRNR